MNTQKTKTAREIKPNTLWQQMTSDIKVWLDLWANLEPADRATAAKMLSLQAKQIQALADTQTTADTI